MQELSLTQEYLLCVLRNKGKISSFDIEKGMCLTGACVLELLLDGIISWEGKDRLSLRTHLPDRMSYLRPVYSYIEQQQPVKFKKIVERNSVTFTDQNINEIIDAVGKSLVEAGCAAEERGGLFGGKTIYVPNEKALDRVIQNIRAELLEDGELSEDIIALTALLDKSGELSRYFSAYEKKALKARLKEIKENPQVKAFQKVLEDIDNLFVLLIVAAT